MDSFKELQRGGESRRSDVSIKITIKIKIKIERVRASSPPKAEASLLHDFGSHVEKVLIRFDESGSVDIVHGIGSVLFNQGETA